MSIHKIYVKLNTCSINVYIYYKIPIITGYTTLLTFTYNIFRNISILLGVYDI